MPILSPDSLERESRPSCELPPKAALDALEGQLKLNDRGQILAIAQDALTTRVLTLCWLDLPMLRRQLEGGGFVGFGLGDSAPVSFGSGVRIVDVRLDCDGDCLILTLLPPLAGRDGEQLRQEGRERSVEPDRDRAVLPSSYQRHPVEFATADSALPKTLPAKTAVRDKAPASRSRALMHHLLGQLRFDRNGLLPAVAQDRENGDVLMQAWMSRESLEQQGETSSVCYWSRSRRQLWVKGEQSGNRQQLLQLGVADDNASLLLQVRQHGHACHRNRRSCFFRRLGRQGLEEFSGNSR